MRKLVVLSNALLRKNMTPITIGYARCSTDKQDLAAQKAGGVASEHIYTDHGLTGTNRARSGLD